MKDPFQRLKRLIGRTIKRSFEIYYEHKFGISTRQRTVVAHASRNADSTVLQPLSYVCLRRIAAFLKQHNFAGGVFIDIGCGTGRSMVFLARLGFRRCIGVEIDSNFAEEARANTAARGCEVICADATSYRFSGEETIIFMSNPFGPVTLREVLSHIPHAPVIVYVNPSADHLAELRRLGRGEPQVFDWNPTTAIVR